MIYVDLDGVLADFNAWAGDNLTSNDQDAYMRMFITHYDECFKTLKPIELGLDIIKTLDKYCILTAMPNHAEFISTGQELGYSVQELERRYDVMRNNKLHWVSKYIGEVPVIIVPSRKVKVNFAKGNVLIDDYYKNIDDWNASGGIGVLFNYAV